MTIIFIFQSSIADKTIVWDVDNGRRRNCSIGAINPTRDNRLYYIMNRLRAPSLNFLIIVCVYAVDMIIILLRTLCSVDKYTVSV